MKDIIWLAGKSGSGKDTAVKLLNPWLADKLYNIKFSEPIKRAFAVYLGVDYTQLEDRAYRGTVIPELGMSPLELLVKSFDVMPQIHPALGLHFTRRQVKEVVASGLVPVFTDLRNPAEAAYLMELVSNEGYRLTTFVITSEGREVDNLPSDRYLNDNLALLSQYTCYHRVIDNSKGTELHNFSTRLLRALQDSPLMDAYKPMTTWYAS